MENKAEYKFAPLVLWCLAGILLIVTWSMSSYWRPDVQDLGWWFSPLCSEYIGGFWQNIDNSVFFTLNGSLDQQKSTWNLIWAIANYRAFDLLAAVFMCIILGMYARENGDRDEFLRRVGIILGCIVYIVISSQLIKLFLRDIDRDSGTIMYKETALLLGEMYPVIDPKDHSSTSFPGDHAIILIGFTISIFRYAKFKYGISALIVTVVFALPRLVGGAHWFSDIAVGAVFIIMISMSILFHTPLYLILEKWTTAVMSKLPLVDWFAKIMVKSK